MQAYPLAEQTLSKKEQLKSIIDQENLDAPKDSVKFLEYMQKHQQKVETHAKRVHTFSKVLFCLGVGAFAMMAYKYFFASAPVEQTAQYSGKSHRLGASNEAEELSAQSQAFSTLSVLIWGFVVTKAKAGVEAAQSKESTTVGGIVKKVTAIIAMIACASLFQLMGSMNTANPVEAIEKVSSGNHKLQAGRDHPDSYYDESSSHYMGGAHNMALKAAKKETFGHNAIVDIAQQRMSGKAAPVVASQKKMGGAHNVAMAVLSQQSANFKRTQANKMNQSYFSNRNVSEAQFRENLRSTGAFLGFISTLALCIAFFVTIKAYHATLVKQDQLNILLNNPNARVASGDQGKKLVKKLQAKDKEMHGVKKEEAEQAIVEQVNEPSKIEELIAAAKTKKIVEEQAEKLLTGYQAPRLQEAAPGPISYNYQLVDPVPQPALLKPVSAQPYFYPQNFEVSAPLPIPQMMTSKVAIQQPEPMREPLPAKKPDLASLPKAELIKALLTQLAKDDIEAQQ